MRKEANYRNYRWYCHYCNELFIFL